MPKTDPFDRYVKEYEAWFERYPHAYQAELRAIKQLIDSKHIGVEIGVGTGRFAEPLGIRKGVEPSAAMADIARIRGIDVVEGVAESLSFEDRSFDFAVMVTTICFVDDPLASFREAYRILRDGGYLVLGFVDSDSPLGQSYDANRCKSLFYAEARFYSTRDVLELLDLAGFTHTRILQTLFGPLKDTGSHEPVREGFGEGHFVAIRADKG